MFYSSLKNNTTYSFSDFSTEKKNTKNLKSAELHTYTASEHNNEAMFGVMCAVYSESSFLFCLTESWLFFHCQGSMNPRTDLLNELGQADVGVSLYRGTMKNCFSHTSTLLRPFPLPRQLQRRSCIGYEYWKRLVRQNITWLACEAKPTVCKLNKSRCSPI